MSGSIGTPTGNPGLTSQGGIGSAEGPTAGAASTARLRAALRATQAALRVIQATAALQREALTAQADVTDALAQLRARTPCLGASLCGSRHR